jgi:flagellar basal body-associated protein FliL
MGARLGLLHDRKKKGDKTDMISGMIMMLLVAVIAIVGFFLYVWLWATKNEESK